MRGLRDYRPLRLLGDGGQGRAWLAMDLRLMRRVVIKTYRHADHHEARRGFLAEARRMARLEGPRVVPVLDAVTSGDEGALVLRYVPGCDLETLLQQRGCLSVANTLSIVTDLAAGLAAARQQLLVHGDIKAANVLLGTDGRAVLTDFGIAVCSGKRSRGASNSALTPEHWEEEALSQQSDFFALGLLTYRMVTGRHLDAGDHGRGAPVFAGLTAPPPLPPDLDPDTTQQLGELLCWLLAPRPQDRPPGTAPLRNRLREMRMALPAAQGLRAAVTACARVEEADSRVPPFPGRLLRPPRLERWSARVRERWRRSSAGARAAAIGSVFSVVWAGWLYAQQPGTCIALLPAEVDLTPAAEQRLHGATALEDRMLQNLRALAVPVQVLGDMQGSDSQHIFRPQGIRNVCEAERRMQLSLRCTARQCQMALRTTAPDTRRRSELRFPAAVDLPQLQRVVDQLMLGHSATLVAP